MRNVCEQAAPNPSRTSHCTDLCSGRWETLTARGTPSSFIRRLSCGERIRRHVRPKVIHRRQTEKKLLLRNGGVTFRPRFPLPVDERPLPSMLPSGLSAGMTRLGGGDDGSPALCGMLASELRCLSSAVSSPRVDSLGLSGRGAVGGGRHPRCLTARRCTAVGDG